MLKLGDDVSYGIADPGYFRKPVFGDEHMQRYGKRRQTIGGARIGFRPVGVAAAQRGSLRVLSAGDLLQHERRGTALNEPPVQRSATSAESKRP